MILVTGASGTNGSELIKLLSQRDVRARGMARRPRTQSDTALTNVEYITADFDEPASLHRSLDGVERVLDSQRQPEGASRLSESRVPFCFGLSTGNI